jgi:hypothetical protein
MAAKRKLWKVTTPSDTYRPESQTKVYSNCHPRSTTHCATRCQRS